MSTTLHTFAEGKGPSEEDLYKCVHCGFCLQACPTYVETGLETESPRGRIALMKAVRSGRIGITPSVLQHWELCIQCRACEAACPSGVPYGRMIEATMAETTRQRSSSWMARLASAVALDHVLPHQRRLSIAVGGARLYRKAGLHAAVRKLRLLRPFSRTLSDLHDALPDVAGRAFAARGQAVPARGEKRVRVGLLAGCVMPLVHGPQMESVVSVLSRNGCEVVVPEGQGCCGAIHSHVGDLDRARELARGNIDAFSRAGVDAVIVASAGCGVRMKEYGDLLRDDPEYAERAAQFDSKVKDVHEILSALPFRPPTGRLDCSVTYQDSCHLSHAQGITRQPRELMDAVPGLRRVEMEHASRCCGAGGTYTITQRDFSLRLLERKMRTVAATGADVLATANPGCAMQLEYGAQRFGVPVKVQYVTDLLEESYGLAEAQ